MARPDPGPLTAEQLEIMQAIVMAAENGAEFPADYRPSWLPANIDLDDPMEALCFVLGFYDAHGRKLLEAAKWALANGWERRL